MKPNEYCTNMIRNVMGETAAALKHATRPWILERSGYMMSDTVDQFLSKGLEVLMAEGGS